MEAFDDFLVIETDTPEQLRQIVCHFHALAPVFVQMFFLAKKNAVAPSSGQELVSRRFVFQAHCPARQSRFPLLSGTY
jgi:hypothetical protein